MNIEGWISEIMNKVFVKKLFSPFIKLKYRVKSKGMLYVGNNTKIKNSKNLLLGKNVNICSNSVLICGDKINLKNGAYIGYFTEIMCIHGVEIGENTICGPYMFITDSNHEYNDINIPISKQGSPTKEENNRIIIGDDCWIGAHVSIIGNVKIGKHSVIAAGAVVNTNIPPYCVAGGVPAKVLKQFNFQTEKWERIKEDK